MIQREVSWRTFKSQFSVLLSARDWQSAATHLRSWTGGKDEEVAKIRECLKDSLLNAIESTVKRELEANRFRRAREVLREQFSSDNIVNVLGKKVCEDFHERIDAAEDRSLYNRVVAAKSVEDKRDRARGYLDSQVAHKRMSKEVNSLLNYLEPAETELTFAVTGIRWGKNCWAGANRVNLTIHQGEEQAVKFHLDRPVQVKAVKDEELDLASTPIEVKFKARLNNRVTVQIEILQDGKKNGSASFIETVLSLGRKADSWLDLSATSKITDKTLGNKFRFIIRDLPREPELPVWKDRDVEPRRREPVPPMKGSLSDRIVRGVFA